MPEAFDSCVKKGGRVVTVSGPNERWNLKAGEYVHICWLGKKPYRGYTKKKEKSDGKEA